MSAIKHINHDEIEADQRATIADTRDCPILFDKEMVRATLSGAKTATRRLFKSPLSKAMEPAYAIFKEGGKWIARLENGQCYRYPIICPFGEPGDYLWIKETFTYDTSGRKIYRASHGDINDKKWTPSIHMSKTASRIWLQITDIKPQRIQTVTEEEAREEGTKAGKILNYSEISQVNFREGFFLKWISIYGIERFYENQWVWAIKYKMI